MQVNWTRHLIKDFPDVLEVMRKKMEKPVCFVFVWQEDG